MAGKLEQEMTEEEFLDFQAVELPQPCDAYDMKLSVQVFSPTNKSPIIKSGIDESVMTTIDFINSSNYPERVIFITHGFMGSIKDKWMHDMKTAILDNSPGQIVVLVGFNKGFSFWDWGSYHQAAPNTKTLGEFIGEVAAQVNEQSGMQIYGIGHCLGSHAMGTAGRYSQSRGFPFSRITGLDPAGPCFQSDDNEDIRLSLTDADFVDVIHTDGKMEQHPVHYGTLIPLGHWDFYPNWGKRGQPGCNIISDIAGSSHKKALAYFTWSISNGGRFRCELEIMEPPTAKGIDDQQELSPIEDELPEMGYYADNRDNTNGLYYIETQAHSPYA